MTLAEFIDRKRQLEVEIAHDLEQRIAAFEVSTGCRVERVHAAPVIDQPCGKPPYRLVSCTVDIRL